MGAVIRSETARGATATALRILAVAVAYYVSGRIGLLRQVTVHGAVVTPLWPPTGVALGCLLYWGLRIWPGIAVGALLAVASTGGSSFGAGDFGIIAGNTLAPVCALLMLRRADFRMDLSRLRDGAALIFLGALGAMLISATTGSVVLLLEDKLPKSGFWPVWFAWWAGDAMGVLMVTPLLLVLRRARLPWRTDRWVEGGALVVAAAVVVPVATETQYALLFLVFPLLIWAALRFELAGSAPCALLVAVLAVVAATGRAGPFMGLTLFEAMVGLTALNGSVALTALLLAAIVTEHKNVRRRIERACEELADVVDQLAPAEQRRGWPSTATRRRDSG
ncbi:MULTISPECIES: MASE1 domain-containing protein [unclassified Streptomyces]|uniref:MASE1 domain-containing protein n=1 Tax=unclassified Streptomyces TaxID=2593676 RepID=UPI002E1A0ED3|nr:MASE1 domain-containing protein [Streptomyces sp. NBC_01023]